MKTSAIASATVLVALSSSLAYGLVTRASWSGMVMGKDGSAIHGNATMVSGADANTTVVDVSLTGDVASTTRPWHVHIGSCAKGGGVLGGGRAYTPLAGDAKGASSSKATLAIAVPDTGSYYVNVHESSANMGKIVACGDLSVGK